MTPSRRNLAALIAAVAVSVAPAGASASGTLFASSLGSSDQLAHSAKKKKCKKGKKCKKKKATPAPSVPAPSAPNPTAPTTPPPSGPPLAPAPKVDTVASAQVLDLPDPADPTLTLNGIQQFTPGQFLAAAPGTQTPDGFLLQVTSSTTGGGQTQVETEPASLYEAVPNGQINADLSTATPLNADARALDSAIADAGAAEGDADVPFSENVSCSAGASMSLSGQLETSLDPSFDLEWSTFLGAPTGIDFAEARVDASVAANAEASVSGAASCELDEVTLLEPKWTVVVAVGPVPVPLVVSVPITASASASVSGAVSIEADASIDGALGVRYDDGEVSGIDELSFDASLDHSVHANASAQAKVGPGVNVQAGWGVPVLGKLAASVRVGAYSGLKLTYDISKAPPGELCVPLTAEGSMTFSVPVVGDFTAGPETLYDTDIVCEDFGGTVGDEPEWRGTIGIDLNYNYSFFTQDEDVALTLNGPVDEENPAAGTATDFTASHSGQNTFFAGGEQVHCTNTGSGSGGGVLVRKPSEVWDNGDWQFAWADPEPTYPANSACSSGSGGPSNGYPKPIYGCLPMSAEDDDPHWQGMVVEHDDGQPNLRGCFDRTSGFGATPSSAVLSWDVTASCPEGKLLQHGTGPYGSFGCVPEP